MEKKSTMWQNSKQLFKLWKGSSCMKNVISTPFGNFEVKQNGEPIEFSYTIKNYSSNKTSSLIRLYVIEVDIKDKPVDLINQFLNIKPKKNTPQLYLQKMKN